MRQLCPAQDATQAIIRLALLSACCLVAMAICASLAAAPARASEEGLIAAYSFDEDEGSVVYDHSGHSNNGTIEGATWTTGKHGSALDFDAEEGDVVTIPDSEGLDTEEFTLEAWVRPNKDNFYGPIVAHTPAGGYGYALFSGNEETGFEGHLMGFISEHQWVNAHTFGGKPAVGAWTHVAVTNDGERIKLYVNGELIDNRESEEFTPSEAPLQIGGDEPFAEGNFFDGKIDEVRVYDRTLDEEEVKDDRKTAIQTPPSKEPVADYSFDEGEGTLAHDHSGNDNDGEIEGAEWVGGVFGDALRFNGEGSGDCVTVPNSEELQLEGAFSLEAWVRPKYSEIVWSPVIAKEAADEENLAYMLLDYNHEGPPAGVVQKNNSSWDEVAGEEELPEREWAHLAFTSDEETLRLYVNGILVGTEPAQSPQSSGGPLRIGCGQGWGEFRGLIDEVRIYDRALDAEELTNDEHTAIDTPPAKHPIAAYPFDEGEGGTAFDSAGEHDGSIEGAEWVSGGKFGDALSFDREAGDSVSIPGSPALDMSHAFTLEAWVKPEINEYWMPIIARETSSYYSYALFSAGEVQSTPQGLAAFKDWNTSEVLGNKALAPHSWAYLGLVSNGETLTLYVNGEAVDSGPARSPQPSEGPLRLGGDQLFEEYFDGLIDNVRIYNRALSSEELASDSTRAVERRPENVTLPSINGVLWESYAVTAQAGEWSSSGSLTYSYQWRRCNSSGGSCTTIPRATDITYIPTAADQGTRLRIKVMAENDGGATAAESAASATVRSIKPTFETPVSIEGVSQDGEILTSQHDGLHGSAPISLSYQWERCNESCEPIAKGDAAKYQLSEPDDASYVRVNVLAENAHGSSRSISSAVGPVKPVETNGPPTLSERPNLAGQYRVGGTLASTEGEWIGEEPIEVTEIHWQRCSPHLEECESIEGANESVYTPVEGDEGYRLRTAVTVENSKGVEPAVSHATPRILPEVNTTFILDGGESVSAVGEAIQEAGVPWLAVTYGTTTSNAYGGQQGKPAAELLAALAARAGEEAIEEPARSITLAGNVPTKSLESISADITDRTEGASLREPNEEELEGGGKRTGARRSDTEDSAEEEQEERRQEFTEALIERAWLAGVDSTDTFKGVKGELGVLPGYERALFTEFDWGVTPEETALEMYENGSDLATEYDVKLINESNVNASVEVPIIGVTLQGLCLRWQVDDFWINDRNDVLLRSDLPANAGLYWDTAFLDPCTRKDITWGIYHPLVLEPSTYHVQAYFEGNEEEEKNASGDWESSPFEWTIQLLGEVCDDEPECVNLPGSIPGTGSPITGPSEVMPLHQDGTPWGGPPELSECFEYRNPLDYKSKTGTRVCEVTT